MDSQKIVEDEYFNKLSDNFFKYLFEAFTDDSKDSRASTILFLIVLAFLAYAGVEAVKLIFRSNFGRKGVSIARLVISVICFLTIGVFSYYYYVNYDGSGIGWASKSSFLASVITYSFLSIFILFKGVFKRNNLKVNQNYRGDSTLLGFLVNDNWKQSQIQNFAEPLLCFVIGIYFSSFNLLWGLPLVFCAISAWLHLGVETFVHLRSLRDNLSDKDSPRNRKTAFSRASN